jgi:hypothetical protein
MSKPTNRDGTTNLVSIVLAEFFDQAEIPILSLSEHADNYEKLLIDIDGEEILIVIDRPGRFKAY